MREKLEKKLKTLNKQMKNILESETNNIQLMFIHNEIEEIIHTLKKYS